MRTRWTSLLIDDHVWTLGLTTGTATQTLLVEMGDEDASASVAKVSAALSEKRVHTGSPLMVGLPSSWCFAAGVTTDGLLRRQRRPGMLYRMEEKLPVDAEAITADFVAAGSNMLGVATLNDRVGPVLEALEAAGLTVAHLCPTALLAAAAFRSRCPPPPATRKPQQRPRCIRHDGLDHPARSRTS